MNDKAKIDALRAALEFYADPKNNVPGARAREALALTADASEQSSGEAVTVRSVVPDWPACNPACDYEDPHGGMHDCRSATCSCEAAKASVARQQAAPAAPVADTGAVTRLDLMSLIRSQMHRSYVAGRAGGEVDPKYSAELEDAVMAVYHGRYITGYDLRKSEESIAPATPTASADSAVDARDAAYVECLMACEEVRESGCESRQGAIECCEAIGQLRAAMSANTGEGKG